MGNVYKVLLAGWRSIWLLGRISSVEGGDCVVELFILVFAKSLVSRSLRYSIMLRMSGWRCAFVNCSLLSIVTVGHCVMFSSLAFSRSGGRSRRKCALVLNFNSVCWRWSSFSMLRRCLWCFFAVFLGTLRNFKKRKYSQHWRFQ